MFFLSELEHKLKVPPGKLDLSLDDALTEELKLIFVDKVIPKLGLCVSVYDIKSIDGGFVLPNTGAPTYTVVFRMIMFRPFVGEVITAKLMESDQKGVRLSLGFFDDIYISKLALPEPSVLKPDESDPKKLKKIWEWMHEETEPLSIHGDEIRFRVLAVNYPAIPLEQEEGSKPFAPMVVNGDMNTEGLGPAFWWV